MQKEDYEPGSLHELLHNIRALRRKLISYGWNRQQAITFILFEFLKLPEPQWEDPNCTVAFYSLKEKYKVDGSTCELLMCLQQMVPDLHREDVLAYLHSVFHYSTIHFGFDLKQSSSDSAQTPCRAVQRPSRLPKSSRPVRSKPKYKKSPSPPPKKRQHYDITENPPPPPSEEGLSRDIWGSEVKMVRKRRQPAVSSQLNDDWEKVIKPDKYDNEDSSPS